MANPAIIGEMVPKLKPMVPAATALVATACLVTAILVPILTAMWARRVGNGAARAEAMPAAHGRPLEQEGHI